MPAIRRRSGIAQIVQEFAWFEPQLAPESPGVRGTPLGLLPNVSYDRRIVKPGPGDLIVLYSDGVSEAANPAGQELGQTVSWRWPDR